MSSEKASFVQVDQLPLIETLYAQYLRDPKSVDISWQRFFEGFDLALRYGPPANGKSAPKTQAIPKVEAAPLPTPQAAPAAVVLSTVQGEAPIDHLRLQQLIDAYRTYGHLHAQSNPYSYWI